MRLTPHWLTPCTTSANPHVVKESSALVMAPETERVTNMAATYVFQEKY